MSEWRADGVAAPVAGPLEAAPRLGGAVRVLMATCLWASSAVLIDQISTIYHLTALQISTWRVLLAAPLAGAILLTRRRSAFAVSVRDLPHYVVAGLIGVTATYLCWTASVQINKPAVAVALCFSFPAFVALGDRFIFGSRLGLPLVAAICVDLLGCALAAGVYHPAELVRSHTGLLIGLGNGLAFSGYTLLGRRMVRMGSRDPVATLFYMFLGGAAGLLTCGFLAERASLLQPHLDGAGWLLMVSLAIGPTLGGYALYNGGLKTLPATLASLLATLEPPLVVVGSYLVSGRSVTVLQCLGIGLIVAAVAVMQLRLRYERG